MKKLTFILFLGLIIFGCSNTKNQQPAANEQPAATEQPEQVAALSVDELYQKAADLEGKEVVVKGTVMHVCKETGQRCFLMGSNENVNIRVEAGEKIGTFSQQLMGSNLEIVGVLKMVKTEAEAHNPGKNEVKEGDETTEKVHKVIADSQEAADVQYFIEGMKVREL